MNESEVAALVVRGYLAEETRGEPAAIKAAIESGGKSLLDAGPTTPGSTLVSIVNDAINQVSTLSGRIGALQSNVIDTNIATLNSALQNVSQAKSDISDTDFAATTASLTRAQILSQSGISVLSIANQTPAQVLKLLG